MILEIIFWLSLLALFHSYFFYPVILFFLSRNKSDNTLVYTSEDKLPFLSILMAVHNEEHVIVEKIRTIYYTFYPLGRFEVLIGSDHSRDGTNRILKVYEGNYEYFHLTDYKYRMGKPAIINQLAEKAKGEILIITDANIFLEISTLFEMVKHFKNPEIGLVDSRVIHRGTSGKGISLQEMAYTTREVSIKEKEGILWGTMMGPFGGCFALRKELFEPVPGNFLVDDFYVNMTVLAKGFKSINSSTAYASEDVSISLKEAFRRKIRIAAGNFQNLARFAGILWPPFRPVSFCFFSHKVLRWLGPFFLIIAFILNIILINKQFYEIILYAQITFFSLPLVDFLIKKLRVEIVFLRYITHFLSMNLAILAGFFRYIKGVKSNIWQPTRRNQSE